MTTNIQKNKEIFFAEKLGHLLNEDWEVSAAPNELTWPDIIIKNGEVKFGLEIREFTNDLESEKGSSKRAKESRNSKTLINLANQYYEKSQMPIGVKIIGEVIEPKKILELLLRESEKIAVWEQKKIVELRNCTIFLTRYPIEMGKYCRWQYLTDRVGWVQQIDWLTIQQLITEKSQKLAKYRTNIATVSLLLVADATFNSGKIAIESEELINLSGFNSVYILIYPYKALKIES